MQRQTAEPLRRLEPLIGRWGITAIVGGAELPGAWTTVEWHESGLFAVQQADADADTVVAREWAANAPFPVTTIMGVDDATGRMTQLYADARGVFRIYEMSLDDGVWRVWRDAPGFYQRFAGTFTPDGATIAGAWERSPDGSDWQLDFEVRYTRV